MGSNETLQKSVMTRQERVSEYVRILNRYGEGNSVWNWSMLDQLADDELFDESKVLEKIYLIQAHNVRIENNPNRYPENIMEVVRQRIGLEKQDVSRDSEINQFCQAEVLELVCDWEGLVGYACIIKSWIKDIYKIDLD